MIGVLLLQFAFHLSDSWVPKVGFDIAGLGPEADIAFYFQIENGRSIEYIGSLDCKVINHRDCFAVKLLADFGHFSCGVGFEVDPGSAVTGEFLLSFDRSKGRALDDLAFIRDFRCGVAESGMNKSTASVLEFQVEPVVQVYRHAISSQNLLPSDELQIASGLRFADTARINGNILGGFECPIYQQNGSNRKECHDPLRERIFRRSEGAIPDPKPPFIFVIAFLIAGTTGCVAFVLGCNRVLDWLDRRSSVDVDQPKQTNSDN